MTEPGELSPWQRIAVATWPARHPFQMRRARKWRREQRAFVQKVRDAGGIQAYLKERGHDIP